MYRQIQNICTYDEDEKYKCMFSSYNGGVGSVINDSKLCAATDGCDPTRWTANIELNSYKARTNLAGYNLSAYKINRAYVDEITTPGKRSLKYHTDYLNRMCVK
jgi:membrane-bound lytic murein transglycosylase MltF